MKTTIYETITNQIVSAIEEGAALYKMPWHTSRRDITSPMNATSGNSYRGLNILTLWLTAEARGFASGTWATYQQWQEKGAQVRKGEKSASVFFWKKLESSEEQTPAEEAQARFIAKGYNVFNADQVDGYQAPDTPELSEIERIERADRFFGAIPAQLVEGKMAAYMPLSDCVEMPAFKSFNSANGFYGVLGHELTHWSGAKSRLDRDLSGRFGSERYAMEELVAELGAAFMGGSLGLSVDPRTDHAPYIATWLKVLKNDSRAIFTAASKAQAAADFLAGFSNGE